MGLALPAPRPLPGVPFSLLPPPAGSQPSSGAGDVYEGLGRSVPPLSPQGEELNWDPSWDGTEPTALVPLG